MAVLNPVQWNFSSGIVGKKFRGAIGSPVYKTAIEYGKNVLITSQGRLLRRPGTEKVKKLSGEVYAYQTSSATGDLASNISKQITFNYVNKDYRIILEHDVIYISDEFDNTVQTINTTGITNVALAELAYDQGRDVIIFCHYSFGFKTLRRNKDGTWTLAALEIEDGPYETLNLDVEKKLKPSAVSGTGVTLQAVDKATTTPIDNFFSTDDIGRLFRLRHSPSTGTTTWGVCKVTATSSPYNTATVDIPTEYELGNTNGVKNWIAGAWYGTRYPTAIAFARNRLWGVMDDRVFGSFADDFNRFSPSTENIFDDKDGHLITDACAIDTRITNLKGDKIHWIHEDEVIHLGGENAHYTIRGSTLLSGITPNTVTITEQSSMGCADVKPISLGGFIYVHKSGKKLITAERNYRTDRYDSIDLNLFADTILDSKVIKLLKMTYPWSMVWCILADGTLACLTYLKDQQIVAWSKHELASGDVTDGCVVRDINGEERIYFTVKQNGQYFVEKMGKIIIDENPAPNSIQLLDGAVKKIVFGSSTLTVNNLQRFENQTVYAIANHIIVGSGTVSSGSVTFNNVPEDTIEVGVAPIVEFRPLPIESKDEETSTIGEKKQGSRLHIGLFNTGHLEVRQTGLSTWQEIPLRSVSDPSANEKSLFTGTTDQFNIPGQRTIDLQYEFRQRLPAPLGVSHIGVKLDISSV